PPAGEHLETSWRVCSVDRRFFSRPERSILSAQAEGLGYGTANAADLKGPLRPMRVRSGRTTLSDAMEGASKKPLLVSSIVAKQGRLTMTAAHTQSTARTRVLYLAFELGWENWKLAFATEAADNPRIRSVKDRNLA